MVEKRKERPRRMRWTDFIYVAVRILKAAVMCETVVFDGLSSALTLRAMQANNKVTLVSIDLPAGQSISGSTTAQYHVSLPKAINLTWIRFTEGLARRESKNARTKRFTSGSWEW